MSGSGTSGASAAAVLQGRPAGELSDAELEAQGTQAHATRNWVFLHGTAEQFARHTSRMFELEQEYLRRHPHRTWQGSGGAALDPQDEAAALREALRGIVAQLDALAAEPAHSATSAIRTDDPVLAVLSAVAAAPEGRLHRLEVHQAAREAGLDRASLAVLYTSAPQLLAVAQQDRVITEAGRDALRSAGRRSGRPPAGERSGPGEWRWEREERPTWDEDKQRIIGGAPQGVFELSHPAGASLPGDWWALRQGDGAPIGYGWMDLAWGDAEILLAVDPDVRGHGAGAAILEHLEQEASARGVNYVYNTVAATHPQREYVHDWLGVRGYVGGDDDEALRKRVHASSDTDGAPDSRSRGSRSRSSRGPAAHRRADAVTEQAPGREDLGGYVDVEDHSY